MPTGARGTQAYFPVCGVWLFFPGSAPLEMPRRTVSSTRICDLFFFSILGPSNHHSQSTLRPPLPPPHNHSLSHHHSSANSLNRNSLTNRRNQIHAPAPAPNDLATTPESVQLQDSWVLNSNVPLETRWVVWMDTPGGCRCTEETVWLIRRWGFVHFVSVMVLADTALRVSDIRISTSLWCALHWKVDRWTSLCSHVPF